MIFKFGMQECGYFARGFRDLSQLDELRLRDYVDLPHDLDQGLRVNVRRILPFTAETFPSLAPSRIVPPAEFLRCNHKHRIRALHTFQKVLSCRRSQVASFNEKVHKSININVR